jgi:hypothetical protein
VTFGKCASELSAEEDADMDMVDKVRVRSWGLLKGG